MNAISPAFIFFVVCKLYDNFRARFTRALNLIASSNNVILKLKTHRSNFCANVEFIGKTIHVVKWLKISFIRMNPLFEMNNNVFQVRSQPYGV